MDLLAGMRVSVRPHLSQKDRGLSYPAFMGVLLDDANASEGWDVVDVLTDDGAVQSIYCFSLERD